MSTVLRVAIEGLWYKRLWEGTPGPVKPLLYFSVQGYSRIELASSGLSTH